MANAAILARVSTAKQAEEGLSLDDQIRRARELAEARGWTVEDRHVYREEGVSGAAKVRPALAALLDAADRGEFSAVIARHIDRIGRSAKDTLETFERLDAADVRIYSDTGQCYSADDAGATFTRNVLAAAADYERAMIRERVTRMTPGKRARGSYNGGPRPYGYEFSDGGLAVREDEAEIVRRIFREYNSGKPLRSLARDLNLEGKRGPLGGSWSQGRVADRLDLELYAGKVGGGEQGRHEALIDAATWKRTRDLRSASLERDGRRKGGRRSNTHLLGNGLLVCECGASFYPRKDTRSNRDTYRCRGRDERTTDCTMPPLPRAAIDGAVRDYIGGHVLSPGMAKGEIEREAKLAAQEASKVGQAAERDASKREKRLRTLRDAWLDEQINRAEYERDKAEVEAELTVAKRRAAEAKQLAADLRRPSDELKKAVEAIRQAAKAEAKNAETLAAQRAAIERLFANFEVVTGLAEPSEETQSREVQALMERQDRELAGDDVPHFEFKPRGEPARRVFIVPTPRPDIAFRFGAALDGLPELRNVRKGLPCR